MYIENDALSSLIVIVFPLEITYHIMHSCKSWDVVLSFKNLQVSRLEIRL